MNERRRVPQTDRLVWVGLGLTTALLLLALLLGTLKLRAAVAVDSLKLTAVEKKLEERQSPEDLFIHSTLFILVDKRAQLRGIFETSGEGVDPAKVRIQLLAAVRRLEHER